MEKSTERWLNNAKMVMSAGGRKLEGDMTLVAEGEMIVRGAAAIRGIGRDESDQ